MEYSQSIKSSDYSLFSSHVILVEPTNFGLNSETIVDNKFMKADYFTENINDLALLEFQNFVKNLNSKDVKTQIFQQVNVEAKDSIFPNNWFSTHRNRNFPEGLLIIYPMKSPNRRLERNNLILEYLKSLYKYFLDLTFLENEGEYIESTGSLIFDNQNNYIFCGISERCTPNALKFFINKFNEISKFPYSLVSFTANDSHGNLIYHTNVLLSVLEKHIVICSDAIQDMDEKNNVLKIIKSLKDKKLIDVSLNEMENFCCNILCLSSSNDKNIKNKLILSQTAYENFTNENLCELESTYELCINNISYIEKVGGGSCRCMIAEIF